LMFSRRRIVRPTPELRCAACPRDRRSVRVSDGWLGRVLALAIAALPMWASGLPSGDVSASAAEAPASFFSSFATPETAVGDNGFRFALVAAGAVTGVIVLNFMSGGAIAPFLAAGAPMPASAAGPAAASATAGAVVTAQALGMGLDMA